MDASPIFVALLREASLAAQLLGRGVTELRKADQSRPGLLNSALFDLSIGFERAAKLILIVDYHVQNSGRFPTDSFLRKFHHDIGCLFAAVKEITMKPGAENPKYPVPDDVIHHAIGSVLSEFAKLTRYQNLDLLVSGKSASMMNPEKAWFTNVGRPILDRHYSASRQAHDRAVASGMDKALSHIVAVAHIGPEGQTIRTVRDAFLEGSTTEVILRHSQFYTLQLIRYFTETLWAVQTEAHRKGMESVPYFSEIFAWFYNDDDYFKKRKGWRRSQ